MTDYILLEKFSKNINVLYIEDDASIRKETAELLEDIFDKPVSVAVDGKDGYERYIDYFKSNNTYFDLIITDIMMPNIDGIDLTEMIYKKNPSQKVIVISAFNDTAKLFRLVNLGIEQFILKPFKAEDFINVIYNVVKKIYSEKDINDIQEEVNIVINKSLTWDNELKQLILNASEIKLTKKEVLFLSLLLSNPNKTYTNEEILIHLWKDDLDSSPDINNLKNVVWRLRKKVDQLDIENIYGFGYRINIE